MYWASFKAGTRFTIDQVVHRTYISGDEINTIYITIIGYDPKDWKIDAGDVFNQFGSEFGEAPSALKDKWGPLTQEPWSHRLKDPSG